MRDVTYGQGYFIGIRYIYEMGVRAMQVVLLVAVAMVVV